MNKALHTDNAPAAIGPYSQAVQAAVSYTHLDVYKRQGKHTDKI